jgi:hypothetical protein
MRNFSTLVLVRIDRVALMVVLRGHDGAFATFKEKRISGLSKARKRKCLVQAGAIVAFFRSK